MCLPSWARFGAKFSLCRLCLALFEKYVRPYCGHLVARLAPSVVLQGHVDAISPPGASISRLFWGDVGINSYVEGMLNQFDPCWCLQLCKNACPQQDQCFWRASCGYLGPFIGSKFGLWGSCWLHFGSKFHHLRAILVTCWDAFTILGPFWCQI